MWRGRRERQPEQGGELTAEQIQQVQSEMLDKFRVLLEVQYKRIFRLRANQAHLQPTYRMVVKQIADLYAENGTFPSILHTERAEYGLPGIFSDQSAATALDAAGFDEDVVGQIFDGKSLEAFVEEELAEIEREVVRDIVVKSMIELLNAGADNFDEEAKDASSQALSWFKSGLLPQVPAEGEIAERLTKKITDIYTLDDKDSPRIKVALGLDMYRTSLVDELAGYQFAYYTSVALLTIKKGGEVSDEWLTDQVKGTAAKIFEAFPSRTDADHILEEANVYTIEEAIKGHHLKAVLDGDMPTASSLVRLGRKTGLEGFQGNELSRTTAARIRQLNSPRKRATARTHASDGSTKTQSSSHTAVPKVAVPAQSTSIKKPTSARNTQTVPAEEIKISVVGRDGDPVDVSAFKSTPKERSHFAADYFKDGLRVRRIATVGLAASVVGVPVMTPSAANAAPASVDSRIDSDRSAREGVIDVPQSSQVSSANDQYRAGERVNTPAVEAAVPQPADTKEKVTAKSSSSVTAPVLTDTSQTPGIKVDTGKTKKGFLAGRLAGRLDRSKPAVVDVNAVSPKQLGATTEQTAQPGLKVDIAAAIAERSGRTATVETLYAGVQTQPMGTNPNFAREQEALDYANYLQSPEVSFKDKVASLESKLAERGLVRVERRTPAVDAVIGNLTTMLQDKQNISPDAKERFARTIAAINYPASMDNVGDTFDASLINVPSEIAGLTLTAEEKKAVEKYAADTAKEAIKARAMFGEEDFILGYGSGRAEKAMLALTIADITMMSPEKIATIITENTQKPEEQPDTEDGGKMQSETPQEKGRVTNETTMKNAMVEYGIPEQYAKLYVKYGTKYKVSPILLAAQGKQESGFIPEVIDGRRHSSAGAQGIAQFMPGTWEGMKKQLGFPDNASPFNPDYAIWAQAALMSSNLKSAKGNIPLALASYNAGWGNIQKYGADEVLNWSEPKGYIQKITKSMAAMNRELPQAAPKPKKPETKSGSSELSDEARKQIKWWKESGLLNGSETKQEVQPPMIKELKDAGRKNGKLKPNEVERLGGRWGSESLNVHAAKAFKLMDAAFYKEFGRHMKLTDGYRTYDEQVWIKARETNQGTPQMAAEPGTSKHGWGLAIDIDGVTSFNSKEYKWLDKHAIDYGWFHPRGLAADTNRPEPWHWNFGLRTS